jgi:AraC-like DNA-binding protein
MAAVARAIESMKAGLGHPQPLTDLARTGMFSPFYFHRMFREVTGMTPARFLAGLRMAEARRLLLYSSMTVARIGSAVGYTSLGTFTTQFMRLLGLSPGCFREVVRSLGDEPVGARLSAVRAWSGSRCGPVVALAGAPGSAALVVVRLFPAGQGRGPGSWAIAAETARVRLPAAAEPGEYAAFSVVVPAEVRLTDAFVDDLPDSYLIGAARVRLSHGGELPQAARMVLRRPRPTDAPVLAVTPLRWLVESSTGWHVAVDLSTVTLRC